MASISSSHQLRVRGDGIKIRKLFGALIDELIRMKLPFQTCMDVRLLTRVQNKSWMRTFLVGREMTRLETNTTFMHNDVMSPVAMN
jgi:hypothetical protein